MQPEIQTRDRHPGLFFSRPALVSLLATLLYFAALLIVLHPRYWSNDDILMAANLAGYMGGKPVPILIYGNVLAGFVLAFLYGLNLKLNWLVWLYLLMHACATWALLYLVVRERWEGRLKVVAALAILSSEAYFVLNLTFTTVAAMASIAGYCLLLASARSPGFLRSRGFWLGCALVVVGSWIRPEATALVLVILLPCLVVARRLFSFRNLVLALAGSSLLVAAGYAFNLAYLRQAPGWYLYYVYTRLIQELQDTPRLVNAAGTIRDIHWTSNDLNMFARWFFPDETLYSVQTLRYLVDHVSDIRPTFASKLASLPSEFFNAPLLPYTLLLFVIGLAGFFLPRVPRQALLILGLTLLLVLGINIYLLWRNRLVDNVFLTSLTACVMFTLFFGYWSRGETSPDAAKRSGGGAPGGNLARAGRYACGLVLLIAIGLVIRESIASSETSRRNAALYQRVLSDIQGLGLGAGGQEAIIISPAFGIPWDWSDPLWIDFPATQYLVMADNTFSPTYFSVLRQHQVGALPGGLYNRDNVYLMTDEATMGGILKYIQYHQGVNVSSRLIYQPQLNTGTVYDSSRLYKLEALP